MSLQSRLSDLATALGLAVKSDRARLTALEALIADRHVLKSTAAQTNGTTTASTILSGNVTVGGGTYCITVSYAFSRAIATSDMFTTLTIGGTAPYVGATLHREEVSEVVTQIRGFTRVFENVVLTAGSKAILMTLNNEAAAVTTIQDIVVSIERVIL